jgi:hypothetical protein
MKALSMKRAFLIVAVVASLPIVASTVAPAHIVWDQETISQLLWNKREAYLLIGMRRTGWWGNYAKLAWLAGLSYIRISTPGRDSIQWVTIIRCTAEGVEEQSLHGPLIYPTFEFDNHVYGRYQGRLAKLVGTAFEKATPDEERRFEAVKNSASTFSGVNGWSKQRNLLSGPQAKGSTHCS